MRCRSSSARSTAWTSTSSTSKSSREDRAAVDHDPWLAGLRGRAARLRGPLTEPTAHGGGRRGCLPSRAPSLPGYGLSGEPAEIGWDSAAPRWLGRAHAPSRLHPLRGQGGDVGAGVTDAMAARHRRPDRNPHEPLVPALAAAMPTETDEECALAAAQTPVLAVGERLLRRDGHSASRRSATRCSTRRSFWLPG